MSAVLFLTVFLAFCPTIGLAQAPPPALTCNEDCQSSQQSSLLELYQATGGPSWFISNFGLSETVWGSEGSNSTGMPAHCSWAWIFCCGTDGYIYLSTALQVRSPAHRLRWCSCATNSVESGKRRRWRWHSYG